MKTLSQGIKHAAPPTAIFVRFIERINGSKGSSYNIEIDLWTIMFERPMQSETKRSKFMN